MAKTKAYKALRASLLADLEARGLTALHFVDKVDEYMDFWEQRQALKKDIAERGVSVEDHRGTMVENRSVSLEIQASRQMLAIFQSLGLKDVACSAKMSYAGDDDDDL